MALKLKHFVWILNRGTASVRKTTEWLPQKTSRILQRHLSTGNCVTCVQKANPVLGSHKSRLCYDRQRQFYKWVRPTGLGLWHIRHCTQTAAPTELKSTRLLTGKLMVPKKRSRLLKFKDDMNVAAYVVGDSINLRRLRQAMKEQGLYEAVPLPDDIKNAIMATAIYKVDSKVRDVFFFGDGRVSCWNMPENERMEILKTVLKYTHQPMSIEAILEEEEMEPVIFNNMTKFVDNTIYLKTMGDHTCDEDIALQKFTFSDAMGQTVMLSFCERKLESFTNKIEPEMQKLRDGIPSKMIITDLNKNRGEVFLLRHEINLESDLLDTPDLYWEREDLEGLYKAMVEYYNIRLRILVFNERLNYCSDFLELLSNQTNDAKHVFLEKVIIVLIMIEVVFGGIPFLESYFPSLFPSRLGCDTQKGNDDTYRFTDGLSG